MPELCNSGDSKLSHGQAIDIPSLIDRQKAFFASGQQHSIIKRIDTLKALFKAIEAREDALLTALNNDLGKPNIEGWLSEIFFLKNEIRYITKRLKKWARPKRVSTPLYLWPARSYITREPYGSVLIIAPWNYPFQLALSPAIGAIAAGNSIVIKPSEATPKTSALMAEIIAEAFDETQATVINGDAEVSKILLTQPFDYFFFTGGEKVGHIVAQAAAREMVPCTLELGGKSPVIIDESANLSIAAERIAAGKFFNAGQTCMAPDFVAVPSQLVDKFESHLQQQLEAMYGANLDELASCPHRAQFDRVKTLIPENTQKVGSDDESNLKLAPRWTKADWNSSCMQEEIFGALLPIITYDSLDDLLQKIASKPKPLALYLFGTKKSFFTKCKRMVSTGSLCINDVMKQAINLELPFGGTGASGYGRYRGKATYETFSWERSIMHRYNIPDIFKTAPPYGNKLKMLRKFLG